MQTLDLFHLNRGEIEFVETKNKRMIEIIFDLFFF